MTKAQAEKMIPQLIIQFVKSDIFSSETLNEMLKDTDDIIILAETLQTYKEIEINYIEEQIKDVQENIKREQVRLTEWQNKLALLKEEPIAAA